MREDDEPRKRRGVNLLLDEAGDRYYETQDIYRGEREGTGESGRRESIIQRDFAHAAGDGYIVLDPQVLHAGNYGFRSLESV